MKEKERIIDEKIKLEESKRKMDEEKRKEDENKFKEEENKFKEDMENERQKIEEEKQKLEEEKQKIEEEKKIIEEEKQKIKEEKEKLEEENKILIEEKTKINEEKKKYDEEKQKLEIEKQKNDIEKQKNELEKNKLEEMERERIKKEQLQKEELEKEKKYLEKLRNINKKRESYTIYAKNNSNSQQDYNSNYANNRNIKEMSENSSTGSKKKTLRDSELDQELLIVNDSNNNDIISIENRNNYLNENIDENNIIDYQRINDKEVTNKIKYELQKDLINKQKKNYNIRIMHGLRNKSQDLKSIPRNKNLMDLNYEGKKNKLTLIDLENNKDKKIKEIELLLKGGIDENKLNKLEYIYKDNKEIMKIINKYKEQKMNLENYNLMEEPLSDSIKIININKLHKSKSTLDDNILKLKENKKIKIQKNAYHNNVSGGNPNNHNQSSSSIQDYCDLSPFYYISNGNKFSKNMWGFNEKNKNLNNYFSFNRNVMTQEQIIQNKLKIYKDKMYKPFFDKVEKEKNKEYKRIQILKKINDPKIKSNLETKFGIERGKIDLELTKEKEKINRAIKEYENELIINENENQKALEQNNIFFD